MTILDRRLDLIERALLIVGGIALALGIILGVTGWHVDLQAVGATVSDLIPQSQTARGERLYAVDCQFCHGGPDIESGRAPYPPPHNATGQTWQLSDCQIVTVVQDGGDATTRALRAAKAPPGAVEMPAFGLRLTPDEITAILAYIKTMWTPEQRAAQENTTRASCPSS